MALSVSINKKSVTLLQEKLCSVTVTMSLKSDGTEVMNRDFSVRYRTGENIANKKAELQAKIQHAIDVYKAEQILNNAAAFANMCQQIQNDLTL